MNLRLDALRKAIDSKGLEAVLVLQPENRNYITGFTGSSGFTFITKDQAFFMTDFRYMEQASRQVDGFEIVQHKNVWEDTLVELMDKTGIKSCGYEQTYVTVAQFNRLKHKLPKVDWVATEDVVENLRLVKDQTEIDNISRAVKIADEGFKHIISFIKPGITEIEVAAELEHVMRKLGSQKPSFDTIIASGIRSSIPHANPTEKVIQAGEFIKMDFGAVYNYYHSDITRTVILKNEPTIKQKEIYEIVLEAQLKAIDTIKPGITGAEVDKVARDYIARKGYGDNFGHGLGHGVGLVIHEGPRFSTTEQRKMEPGMVITVEPGIYLPNWGGVRIEDIVLVTETGCKVLTEAPKELMVV